MAVSLAAQCISLTDADEVKSIPTHRAAFFDIHTILAPNFIEVVFYRDKYYSMNNRRLWCLKQFFAVDRLVQVKAFVDEQ